jgi:Xaa-Pro aminopeptidase
MAATRPGGHEAQIRALIDGIFTAAGARPSYAPIVTVRGEILHCRSNPHPLGADDLLLVDAGCETPEGYAADVTRAWPVRGRFDARQRAVYEIVLEAQLQCIDRVRPGTEYLDVHMHACRVIAQGLRDLGLLRGSVDDLVAHDAHAVFFPHGIGHLIGLDVHDIEDLGDRAGYAPDRRRSDRFGLAWLRLNRRLEPGMAVTIEPGIYFIPGLLNSPEVAEKYKSWIDLERARTYLGFGGIRIEDDVVTTQDRPEVLTGALAKRVADVEAVVGTALEGLGAIAG